MQKEIVITSVRTEKEIQQILSLQQKNLPHNISRQEAIEQGFVTVEHSFDLLKRMHDAAPAVIAKYENKVIGYALVMLPEFQEFIPVLQPMFQMFDEIDFENKKLSAYSYFVMGQVCIDKNFRGLGIFDMLYQKLKELHENTFEIMLTEVAKRNIRSLKAHERAGLKSIHEYTDNRGETWEILLWNFKA